MKTKSRLRAPVAALAIVAVAGGEDVAKFFQDYLDRVLKVSKRLAEIKAAR